MRYFSTQDRFALRALVFSLKSPFMMSLSQSLSSVRKIKLGNGFHEETQSGPLISAEHRSKVEKYVEIGLQEGAKLETGGKRPEDPELANGFFYLPTIFSSCTSDMRIVKEEVFGPVLTVETFKTEEEVVSLANDTIYGLAGAVWSKDIEKRSASLPNCAWEPSGSMTSTLISHKRLGEVTSSQASAASLAAWALKNTQK